jgi:PAS domain S-box-containing protein
MEPTEQPLLDDSPTIHSLKILQERLAAAEEAAERFRSIVEATGDAPYRLRFDSLRYDYMSPAIERLTGYTVEEINERGFDRLVERVETPGTGKSVAPNAVERQRAAGDVGSYRADYLIRTKHGEHRWLADHSESWRDASGALIGSVGFLSDITRRKELEEQLRQAQKMEAVGQLAGGVAHDFNNLLTVISGYGEILSDMLPPDSAESEAVAQIIRAADSAAALTRQLLAFSRRQMVAPKVINLNEVVEQVAKMLGRIIGEDVTLALTLAPDLALVRADPGQIEQLLLNLASNARDAMPQGGALTIETANVDRRSDSARSPLTTPRHPEVMLRVSDSGVGMDAATQARIFEPFFTTKALGKGTGLGLAAVYGIVQQSDGEIVVESAPGQGTHFRIHLPGVLVPAPTFAPLGQLHPRPTGQETILLVEDKDQVRALARLVLEMDGYTVLEAENGDQALAISKAAGGAIDVLLTDVVMPGLNGRQVADLLLARHPGLKVLYISGYADTAIITQQLTAAGSAFLPKPFSPAELSQKIREVLDGE